MSRATLMLCWTRSTPTELFSIDCTVNIVWNSVATSIPRTFGSSTATFPRPSWWTTQQLPSSANPKTQFPFCPSKAVKMTLSYSTSNGTFQLCHWAAISVQSTKRCSKWHSTKIMRMFNPWLRDFTRERIRLVLIFNPSFENDCGSHCQ